MRAIKPWLISLLTAANLVGADSPPSRISFTNLQGIAFLNVTPVKTNKDELIFKQSGQRGFFNEKLTNLALEVRWPFLAQERAVEAERSADWLRQVSKTLIEYKDHVREVTVALRDARLHHSDAKDYGPWDDVRRKCDSELIQMKRTRLTWAKQTNAPTAELDDLIASESKIAFEARAGFEKRFKNFEDEIGFFSDQAPWKERSLTAEQRSSLFDVVTNAVTIHLLAPRTAIYEGPSALVLDERNGITRVRGVVDSQNAFGALIRGSFVVQLRGDKILSVNFPEESDAKHSQ